MVGAVAGYDYGNARVRARKAELLAAPDYEALLGRDLSDLLSALSRTAYQPDVDAAITRFDGMRALHEAVRRHEARTVRAVRGFYSGEAADGLAVWASRYDVANLVTLLRGHARSADPADILPLLVPAGRIDDAVLADLARQPSLHETVDRLVVWALPTRRVAARMAAVWPEVARRGDAVPLETALLQGWAAEVRLAIEAGGDLAEVLQDELDQANLLLVLRLHADRARSAPDTLATSYLPGGRLGLEPLTRALLRMARTEVVRDVRDAVPTAWRPALDAWSDGSDATAVADALDAARARATHGLFQRGDPLGIGVPVAFLSAVQVEARNLRAVGRGAAHAIPRDLVRSRLVILEER